MSALTLSALLARVLSSGSPTRAVESLLAWIMVVWGVCLIDVTGLIQPADIVYAPLLAIAPQSFWAWASIVIGLVRLCGLVINGHWRRSPIMRMAGAMVGFIWWSMLLGLYMRGIALGAKPFPLWGAYMVFLVYEGLSAFRCGVDAREAKSFGVPRRTHLNGGGYVARAAVRA